MITKRFALRLLYLSLLIMALVAYWVFVIVDTDVCWVNGVRLHGEVCR